MIQAHLQIPGLKLIRIFSQRASQRLYLMSKGTEDLKNSIRIWTQYLIVYRICLHQILQKVIILCSLSSLFVSYFSCYWPSLLYFADPVNKDNEKLQQDAIEIEDLLSGLIEGVEGNHPPRNGCDNHDGVPQDDKVNNNAITSS